jgi:leucyl-tRNA synthetase
LQGKELQSWMVQEILGSEEWIGSHISKNVDIAKAKKIIVVRGGKTINFVL